MTARLAGLAGLLLTLSLMGCARPGVAPGDATRGYVVWGYVGNGPHSAAAGQQVALLDQAGTPVATTTADHFGKYVFAYHRPGRYAILAGPLTMPIAIAATDQRIDIDLTSPTGAMNYAQQPPSKQGKGERGQPATGPNGEPLPDLDASPPGTTDCWAAAGCGGYDGSTDTYVDTSGAPM